jgi:hypothetical protein
MKIDPDPLTLLKLNTMWRDLAQDQSWSERLDSVTYDELAMSTFFALANRPGWEELMGNVYFLLTVVGRVDPALISPKGPEVFAHRLLSNWRDGTYL